MTASCQFLERHAAHARLGAAAHTSEPALASTSREQAVRSAALAGCGRGNDATRLTQAERTHFRDWARQWFRVELDAAAPSAGVRGQWKAEPSGIDVAIAAAPPLRGAWIGQALHRIGIISQPPARGFKVMGYFTTQDGTQSYFKD